MNREIEVFRQCWERGSWDEMDEPNGSEIIRVSTLRGVMRELIDAGRYSLSISNIYHRYDSKSLFIEITHSPSIYTGAIIVNFCAIPCTELSAARICKLFNIRW